MIGIRKALAVAMVSDKLSSWVRLSLRSARQSMLSLLYTGKGRFCPVCGKWSRQFRSWGAVPRKDAQCVRCGALERHRLTWLFLETRTNLFTETNRKVLHVAPERCFEPRLKARLGSRYLTADLFMPRAMIKMDICDIRYPDESFDVIYCSHVLEHVPDDRAAIREFFRVLKRYGWAVLNVPITTNVTFEDPSIVDPEERLKAFGQEDHLRRYGPDYIDRLRAAGFSVQVFAVEDLVTAEEAAEMGLTSASGEVYFCTK